MMLKIALKKLLYVSMIVVSEGALYDTYTGTRLTPERDAEVRRLNLIPWCAIEVADCNANERRRMDYSCNNPHYPPRGATLTPYYRLLPAEFGKNNTVRPAKDGQPLPHVRDIRIAVMSDGRRCSDHYTQLSTHIGVFLTADVSSLHDTVNYVLFTRHCCTPGGEEDPRCSPIRVADDDVHLRRSSVRCMNLTRPITYQMLGCAPANTPPARINTSPPMLDISIVYGNEEPAMRRSKEGSGGRIKTELLKGKEWPPSGAPFCVSNQRQRGETRCHNSANPGINSILGVNLFGLWFIRNHNKIARDLEQLNPCWSDDQLFAEARDINIALWQQMVYYEYMPAFMGYNFLLKHGAIHNTAGHVDDYNEDLEPRLSIEFIFAYRWFHTMQEGRLRFYDNNGKILEERSIVDYILRTGALPLNNTIEGLTQGAFRQPAGDNDWLVDPDMGERVLGPLQFASDVVSSDLMKGRDMGMQSYNQYRRFCGLPAAEEFQDLRHWMKEEQAIPLEKTYRHVDDIDLMAGMMAEYPMPGAAVGPTLACIMMHQMKRWRASDRFWYENSVHPGSFSTEQLIEIRKFRLSRLLCDHGDSVDRIQSYAFMMPSPGNEIRLCPEIPEINMAPWKVACAADKNAFVHQSTLTTLSDYAYFTQYGKYFKMLFGYDY